MNKRKIISLRNMKKRIRHYAFDERDEEIQYELFQLLGQFDNVLQWVEEE